MRRVLLGLLAESIIWIALLACVETIYAVAYGPARETCTTTGGTVLTNSGSWESTIANANSGSVFLLRAGTYNFGTDSAGMLIPNGVTVRAYGNGTCEDVVITGASTADDLGTMIRMEAGSTLRGVRLEAATGGNRHESVLRCNARDVSLINNTLYGGTGDSFEVDDLCHNFRMIGNDINGSSADDCGDACGIGRSNNGGHNFSWPGGFDTQPNVALIQGNKICSDYFPDVQKADDVVAIQSGTGIVFEHNYFPTACTKNRENLFDIKSDTCSAAGSLIFRRNYIARNFYVGTVGGQDGGAFQSAFTIGDHCGNTPPQQHTFEYNFIGHCNVITTNGDNGVVSGGGCGGGGTGNAGPDGDDPRVAHMRWAYNVFLQDGVFSDNNSESRVQFGGRTYDLEFVHNTFIRGRWRLQNQNSGQAPGPATIRDNIFYDTYVRDESANTDQYTNSHNTFFSIQEDGMDFDDGNNLTTDPLLRDTVGTTPSTTDFNLEDISPARGSASDGTNRGAFQEITYVSGQMVGTALTLTYNSATLPMSDCTASLFDIEYNGVDATEVSCAPGPLNNQVTIIMSQPAPAGTTVTAKWSYGAVEDSLMIGGPEINLNNKLRARTSPATIGNVAETEAWVLGNQVTCAGSNRIVLAALCWEDRPETLPLEISNVRVGGQLGTKIGDADAPDGELGIVGIYAAMWYFKEAQLDAASNTIITYDTNKTPDATRPIILSNACYTNIVDQATPIADSEVRGVTEGGTLADTPALTTTNPGAAAFVACAATPSSWTVGAGWEERFDVTSGNNLSQVTADRTTNGTSVTPSATGTAGTRRAIVAVSIDGGEEVEVPPVTDHRLTNTAVYRFGRPEGAGRVCRKDAICEIAPTRRFVARAQVEIEGSALAETPFEWWCADNGGDHYQVTSTSTGLISLTESARSGEVLTNKLDLAGDTFVSCGTHYATASGEAACAADVGRRFEYEMAAIVSASATPGQTISCELRKNGNVLLDTLDETLNFIVVKSAATGF